MTLLIVEDEALAVEKLRYIISVIEKDAEIVGDTASIQETVTWLQHNEQPDIILMDIELSDGQSFEIFNKAEINSTVIFTTSYDEYALKAFKVNSIDYLLKPIQKEDLKAAFDKYKKIHRGTPISTSTNMQQLLKELQHHVLPKEFRQRFLVKQGQKHLPIETENIAYFFVDDRIIFFKTKDNKKFIVDYTMDEIEEQLDPKRFFRINRSFIISIESIYQLHDYVNSRLLLRLTPEIDKEVLVSREKVYEFKKWIGK